MAHQPHDVTRIVLAVRVGLAFHLILVDHPFERRPHPQPVFESFRRNPAQRYGLVRLKRPLVVDVAWGLKTAVMLLNPARIVIGGGIAKAGEALFGPLRAELRRQVTRWSMARLDAVPAALEDDSVLWGGLALK